MVVNFSTTDFRFKNQKMTVYKQESIPLKRDISSDTLTLSRNTTTFAGGKKLAEVSLLDFQKRVCRSKIPLNKLINDSIKGENFLGEGGNSKVYKIPNMEDYVIKVFKDCEENLKTRKLQIIPEQNPFGEKNVGQPIARICDGVLILKKQTGKEHSIANWSDRVTIKNTLTPEDVGQFAADVEKISKMPEETFDDLAQTVVLAQKNGYKMDSINPNNILIDYDKQKINLIDLDKISRPDKQRNSFVDTVCPLLDFTLFKDYHDAMGAKEQKKLINNANTVAQKCFNASQKAGLETDESIFINFVNHVNKYFHFQDEETKKVSPRGFRARYNELRSMIILPQEK